MTPTSLRKHESILGFLAQLSSALDSSLWTIVDHSDCDLHSISVALRTDTRVLVYVSTWRQPPRRYYYELELPPPTGSDFPYRPAGEKEGVEFPEVLRVIEEHFAKVARA